jgi:hypothetical protein
MFHDMGLTPAHSTAHERFEVNSATPPATSSAVTALVGVMSGRLDEIVDLVATNLWR